MLKMLSEKNNQNCKHHQYKFSSLIFLETSNFIKVFFLVNHCGFKLSLPLSMFMNNDITLGRSGITIKSTILLTKIQRVNMVKMTQLLH